MGGWAQGLMGAGDLANQIGVAKDQVKAGRLSDIVNQLKLRQIQQQLQLGQQKLNPQIQIDQAMQQKAAIEKAIGRPLTEQEILGMFGVTPQKVAAPTSPYIGQPVKDASGNLWDTRKDTGVLEKIPVAPGQAFTGETKPSPQPRTAWKVDTIGGVPHDVLYDASGNVVKVGGVHYERPEKASGGEKPLTPAQIAAQFNQTLSAFKTQLAEASTAYNAANSQKSQHPIYSRMGLLGTDPDTARAQRDRAAKAVSYLLSKKQAVLSGKADAQEVSDQAQAILDGSDSGSGAQQQSSGVPEVSRPKPDVVVIE